MIYEPRRSISNIRQSYGQISKKLIFAQIPPVIRLLDDRKNL